MEEWERWVPVNNFPSYIYMEYLEDKDELELLFKDERNSKVLIRFNKEVLCYRNRDEGYFLKKLAYLNEKYPIGFYSEWPLFRVANSEYIQWFHQESLWAYKNIDINHFVFITPDDVIEVLSTSDPIITIENATIFDKVDLPLSSRQ